MRCIPSPNAPVAGLFHLHYWDNLKKSRNQAIGTAKVIPGPIMNYKQVSFEAE